MAPASSPGSDGDTDLPDSPSSSCWSGSTLDFSLPPRLDTSATHGLGLDTAVGLDVGAVDLKEPPTPPVAPPASFLYPSIEFKRRCETSCSACSIMLICVCVQRQSVTRPEAHVSYLPFLESSRHLAKHGRF
jgi:hypothetical protein